VGSSTNGTNGAGASNGHGPVPTSRAEVPAAPPAVADLARACVRFVEKALGVALDYTLETLPVLDHYLREARRDAAERPAAGLLVAHAAGAYLGEVVRRRHVSWWRTEGDDPAAWRIELESVYLSFSPVELIADVLMRAPAPLVREASAERLDTEEEPAEGERLELEEEDRKAVAERLAELPPVGEDEFYAPSTRVEVIDIAVDAIRARRIGDGEGDSVLGPDDYER
jgi:hypothetical protein